MEGQILDRAKKLLRWRGELTCAVSRMQRSLKAVERPSSFSEDVPGNLSRPSEMCDSLFTPSSSDQDIM